MAYVPPPRNKAPDHQSKTMSENGSVGALAIRPQKELASEETRTRFLIPTFPDGHVATFVSGVGGAQ